MRIGVVGPFGEDDFAWNVAEGLGVLGHQAVSLGPVVLPPRTTAQKALRQLGDIATHSPRVGAVKARRWVNRLPDVDLVVTVQPLHPVAAAEMSKHCPVALWYPDAVSNYGDLSIFEAPYAGLFLKEPSVVRYVGGTLPGYPIHYLPEACNPGIHRPVGEAGSQRHVVAAGNFYPTRVRLLERLHADGIPLALYGAPLAQQYSSSPIASLHQGRYLRGEAKARVFHEAAAVLNNLHPAEDEGVNCRVFEATACGAATVTEHRKALPELFEDDEVVAFTDYDELLSSLRGLLDDPSQADGLRTRASERAHRDHTYALRLEEMLAVLDR